MKTIDITPTWEAAVQIFMAVLANPDASYEARRDAQDELLRLGRIVDSIIEERKAVSA